MKIKKRFPIFAGMRFGTTDNKIKKVGYKIVEFVFTEHNQLITEREIKRVIY
jgi:hypothetical protein